MVNELLAEAKTKGDAVHKLESQLSEFGDRSKTAVARLTDARKAFEDASAKALLGELPDAKLKPLREELELAEKEAAGLPGAIAELERRLSQARSEQAQADDVVLTQVASMAGEEAAKLAREIQLLAEQLGATMVLWSQLESLSRRNVGFVTGDAQIQTMGVNVAAILRDRRISGPNECEDLYVRLRDNNEADHLSPVDFLEMMGVAHDQP